VISNDVPASIVFVHGLNGDRISTWSSKSGVFWPRTLLPGKLPPCRVMTFGYNADLGLSSSSFGIREFAESLLSKLQNQRTEPDVRKVTKAHREFLGLKANSGSLGRKSIDPSSSCATALEG
jgi:hypothetical protein